MQLFPKQEAIMSILLCTVLCIVAFFVRVWPRLSQKRFGIDSWYFLLYAEQLRKDKRLPVILPYFLLDIPEQWYPPVLPIFLSFFSKDFLEKYNWALSALIDVLQIPVLYCVSYLLTKSMLYASMASLFYAASPILVTQNSNLNSRALGSLFFTLLMLCYYGYVSVSNSYFLIPVLIFGSLLVFTHKLATQQAVFIMLAFSFILLDLSCIFILAGIVLCAVFFSGGFYLKILKGHIEILMFWKKNLSNLYVHPVYRSPLYFDKEKAAKMKGCGGIASNAFWMNLAKLQFIILLITVGCYAFLNRQRLPFSETFFLNWFFINILCIVAITYYQPIKFLGEGQRYFTYGIFPASFLLSRLLFVNYASAPAVVFLLISFLLIFRINGEQRKNMLAAIDTDLAEIVCYIKTLPRDNVMCFPVSYCEYIAYFCKKKTLWGAHGSGYDKMQDFWPVLLKPVEYFIQAYDISYCLLNEKYLCLKDLKLSVNYRIIKQKNQYLLLEFVVEGIASTHA